MPGVKDGRPRGAAEVLASHPKAWEVVREFEMVLRRGEHADSASLAVNVASVLSVIVLATCKGGGETVDTAVRSVGRYLTEASKTSGFLVGNITRRVMKLVREIFADPDPEFSIKENLRNATSLFLDDMNEALTSMMENAAVAEQIHSDEVILTFGWSTTVEKLLKEAAKKRRFELIVAENSPECAGQGLARALASEAKLNVTLIPDVAIFAVMPRVHKVLLEAEAVMANGTMLAPSGTLLVATAARYYAKPILFCAELYKLTPSFPHNSMSVSYLQHPAEILRYEIASQMPNVDVLNPAFDHVPSELVSLLLTDSGVHSPSVIYRLVQRFYDEVGSPL
mmetsp:Transcript_11583/g.35398  ORF Transcript_11583/g.35398 Transcript_11583/m.35398 type:complete len:339 (+) Transcript_11583:389-1405(+)